MKKKLYSITTILAITAMFSFSSCLKDSKNYVNVSQSPPLAELPLEAYNGIGSTVAEAFPLNNTPQTIQLAVNIASANAPSSATTVTLALDTAAVTAYNTANGTSDVLLPASDYTISTLSVVVPAGQHLGYTTITITNPSLLNPANVYILPIKIANAGGVTVDQFNELLYAVQVKNVYDGAYTVTGTLADNTSAAITGAYPEKVYLETTGANSAAFYDVSYSYGFGHAIDGGASYYGSFAPVFTFNGNTITGVTNYYGQFSGSHARSAVLDPSGVNKFTTGSPGQAGSIFQVTYDMQQGNPGVTRTVFTETFTYTGARP